MQALILAAGMGERLGDLTADQTKGMVRVNGVRLIERAVIACIQASIQRVVVVLGHAGESLRVFLLERFPELDLVFVENPSYSSTNNIYSLWLARHHLLADDTLILESDVIFEPGLLRRVVEDQQPSLAVVAPFESWMDGTVTILDKELRISEVVPRERFDWSRVEQYFKTVNIYKFSKSFSASVYVPSLDAFIKAHGKNQFYEMVLTAIADDHDQTLAAHLFEGDWYEIDDQHDLTNAETLFAKPQDKLARLQSRFGGYWRFPKLLDFCYLVNPYFPPEQMVSELQAGFATALRSYPSTQRLQAKLAATAFGGEAELMVVGNGASELIRISLSRLRGTTGIVCPTFNEYLDCAPEQLQTLVPKNRDFSYSVDQLLAFGESLATLILVNPDNPSGHCLPHSEVLRLANQLDPSCRLIVDESFVDFAEEGSLLSPAALRDHPNMVVIKSIGKSYGVPGLRLGVLASADLEFLEQVRNDLPIWNINSTAELFLQIFPSYRPEYVASCQALAKERLRFEAALREISFLRVIPSRANYFLCEVLGPMTSTALASALLAQHKILIKDCAGKPGFESGHFVRFSVRNEKDNDLLLAALREHLCSTAHDGALAAATTETRDTLG